MTVNMVRHSAASNEQFAADISAEGAPEEEFTPGIARRLPSKSVAAGVLVQDAQERILFVTPTYKPYLEIPGGIVERNESPASACRREVREELGIEVGIGRLLVVDWVPRHGVWRDSIQMIFSAGALSHAQVESITLPADELRDHQFLTLDSAKERLKPSLHRRLRQALMAQAEGVPRYTEFGRLPA